MLPRRSRSAVLKRFLYWAFVFGRAAQGERGRFRYIVDVFFHISCHANLLDRGGARLVDQGGFSFGSVTVDMADIDAYSRVKSLPDETNPYLRNIYLGKKWVPAFGANH